MSAELDLSRYRACLEQVTPVEVQGKVTQVIGLVVEASGPACRLGAVCDIHTRERRPPLAAEVMGFRENRVLLMPLEEIRGIAPGCRVVARQQRASVRVGSELLGRVVDGLGLPIDGKGPVGGDTDYPLYAAALNPMSRRRIHEPLDLGIRAIDGLLTIGRGQRIGIFAGSGVGKSVLLGMIARNDRGRRQRHRADRRARPRGARFHRTGPRPGGPGRSVVVVATSDRLPLVRTRGAFLATAIAEYFRDQRRRVILMMDSVTRFAMAQREIGLAVGEPPTTKGYTPSVFALLPKLLERAGTGDGRGSITGLYTVLVEGDDINEPIADAARSILDGHIVLTPGAGARRTTTRPSTCSAASAA